MRADDVMALVKAFVQADREQFNSVALMIAANDAKLWGGQFANEIRKLVNTAPAGGLTKLPFERDGQQESVYVSIPPMKLDEMVLDGGVRAGLESLIAEHGKHELLAEHGLKPSIKVLFDGPPGTGKTSAAGALADALGVPFVVAKQHELIDSHMGVTGKNLASVFDFAAMNRAVILLDEFDSFGTARSNDGSSASKECNRIVNSLLQMIDRHTGPAILVAATNMPEGMDKAMMRRFDSIIHFPLPTEDHRAELSVRILSGHVGEGVSHAEIVRDCMQVKKMRILSGVAV